MVSRCPPFSAAAGELPGGCYCPLHTATPRCRLLLISGTTTSMTRCSPGRETKKGSPHDTQTSNHKPHQEAENPFGINVFVLLISSVLPRVRIMCRIHTIKSRSIHRLLQTLLTLEYLNCYGRRLGSVDMSICSTTRVVGSVFNSKLCASAVHVQNLAHQTSVKTFLNKIRN